MFQFAGFPSPHYYGLTAIVHVRMHEVSSCGFPHSDTHGSLGICPSPWLFAACRVFLRLLVPRHPPCALISLTCFTAFRRRLHSVAARAVPVFFPWFSFLLVAFLLPASLSATPASIVSISSSLFLSDLIRVFFCSSIRFSRYNSGLKRALPPLLRGNVSLLHPSGLKWTRTTDLTLIRRAL